MLLLINDIDKIQKLMPAVLIATTILLVAIVFVIIKVILKTNSQKALAKVDISDFVIFNDINIEILNRSTFSSRGGIPINAKMLINNSQLILLQKENPKIFDISINLPITLYNSKNKDQCEIKIFGLKEIKIILHPGKELFKITQEITLRPKNKEDFENIKNEIKNWC
jgi:hypothetical protein